MTLLHRLFTFSSGTTPWTNPAGVLALHCGFLNKYFVQICLGHSKIYKSHFWNTACFRGWATASTNSYGSPTFLFPLNCAEWNECLPSWHSRNGWGRRSFLGIDIFPNWDELTGRMKVHPRKTIKCALYHLRSPQRFHRKWKQTWQEEQCC